MQRPMEMCQPVSTIHGRTHQRIQRIAINLPSQSETMKETKQIK